MNTQKQLPSGALTENMQQIYKRTPIPKSDFNKAALQSNFIEITLRYGYSPNNLLHIFRTPFTKNTSERLLLDTDSFIVYIKVDGIYEDIAEGVETRFDTSNYELERPLSKQNNKRAIGLVKDELSGKIMTEFVGSRVKTYSYLIDDGSENTKEKVQNYAL